MSRKYTESDAAYHQSKKNDPGFKARRAANERAYRARLKVQGVTKSKKGDSTYEAKNGIPYTERGTTCFPGISTKLVESRTAHNWKKNGIKFESQEIFDYWANRYNAATVCEATGEIFIAGDKMRGKCLDHDHATGKPRGVINGKMNLVLGRAEEIAKKSIYSAAEILIRMDLYLKGELTD